MQGVLCHALTVFERIRRFPSRSRISQPAHRGQAVAVMGMSTTRRTRLLEGRTASGRRSRPRSQRRGSKGRPGASERMAMRAAPRRLMPAGTGPTVNVIEMTPAVGATKTRSCRAP